MKYEKPTLMVVDVVAEGVFMASGDPVKITNGDAYIDFNRRFLNQNNGSLVITNANYAGKSGTVTFRIYAPHSFTLVFNGTSYWVGLNGSITITINNIVVNQPYSFSILTGDVSLMTASSEGGGEITIEIAG